MVNARYESPLYTVLLFVIIFFGFIAIAVDPWGAAANHGFTIDGGTILAGNPYLLAIGLAMLIVGTVIRSVAMATLKKNFSGLLRLRDDHTLVTKGIYRRIRHPAYLGAILIFLSFPIIIPSILGFIVMFLLVPYLLHRITLEERMMVSRFGTEYDDYRKRSKRLIPFVY